MEKYNYKVWEGKPESEVIDVYFKLINKIDGSIGLIACNNQGKRFASGFILDLEPTPTGLKILRHSMIDRNLGFSLDDTGRIEVI